MGEVGTIGDYLEFLRPGLSRRKTPPPWPPDVFGISSALLLVSGAYLTAASKWPPGKQPDDWVPSIRRVASKWRKLFRNRAPKQVADWWTSVIQGKTLSLTKMCRNVELCRSLLQLLAAADESSAGAGVPSPPDELDDFDFAAGTLLRKHEGETLCDMLDSAPIRVLPKMHAPQSGLTIRSFSHHLALITGHEIKPKWFTVGAPTAASLRLLIIPWPKNLNSSDFKSVPRQKCVMRNMPGRYGFFEFEHVNGKAFVNSVLELFQQAHSAVGDIDAVILPECSIDDAEFDSINSILVTQRVLLIAGVRGPRHANGTVCNGVRYNIPIVGHEVPVRQAKHHRWRLDSAQIRNYHLEHQLSPKRLWWEHIPVEDRTVNFIAFRPWLAMCALICEDLARPDPVGDVIRAIGPNLIVALLLDGPQLPHRWPGRYATVLADDPGSSVLTLTSAGMSQLSRPRYMRGYKKNCSIIACWKDIRGSAIAIDIKGGDAAILDIKIDKREEWTADGRSDRKQAGYPLLQYVHVLGKGRVLKKYDVRT